MKLLFIPYFVSFLIVALLSQNADAVNQPKVLVLGGSGFVGSKFIERACGRFEICSVSRRGKPSGFEEPTEAGISWLKIDAANITQLEEVFEQHGPFDACFHSIGLLLDTESGLNSLNKFASGSGSIPGPESTYDRFTRLSAFNALDLFAHSNTIRSNSNTNAFVFISAAEAGWSLPAPIAWLEKYLTAKRSVENKMLGMGDSLRPVVFRPSLIWTWTKPQALVSVVPFYVASALKVPFVDRPTILEDLIDASMAAISSPGESGVKRFFDIDRLARRPGKISKR